MSLADQRLVARFRGAATQIAQSLIRRHDSDPEAHAGAVATHDADLEAHGLEDTGWIAPTFQNSWQNYGADGWETAAYRRVNGVTYLRGLVNVGTMGQTIFTLPAGFRPDSNKHISTVAGGVLGTVKAFSDGRIVADAGSNAWFSLANISFPADL